MVAAIIGIGKAYYRGYSKGHKNAGLKAKWLPTLLFAQRCHVMHHYLELPASSLHEKWHPNTQATSDIKACILVSLSIVQSSSETNSCSQTM